MTQTTLDEWRLPDAEHAHSMRTPTSTTTFEILPCHGGPDCKTFRVDFHFPWEIWLLILGYLDHRQLRTFLRVSRAFGQTINRDEWLHKVLFRSRNAISVTKQTNFDIFTIHPALNQAKVDFFGTDGLERVEFETRRGIQLLGQSSARYEKATDPPVTCLFVERADFMPGLPLLCATGVTVAQVFEELLRDAEGQIRCLIGIGMPISDVQEENNAECWRGWEEKPERMPLGPDMCYCDNIVLGAICE